jgi:alpha-glucosidase
MTPWIGSGWDARSDGVCVTLDDGAQLQVRVLGERLARVTLKPHSGYREPRTWSIAPTPGVDVPWEGRARDDVSGFAPPAVRSSGNATLATVEGGGLTLQLSLNPLRLEWRDAASGALLQADRETTAYLRERRTGAVRHYLARDRGDRYYGLGDKTGPLNLHGRRLRTLAMDSLGYDPQRGDPLYKHWPFVLTRNANGTWVGLYYDSLATCTFDLGCEHDNYHGFFRHVELDDGDLDYYLLCGDTPAQVIAQYVKLIGGTHLPPRWSVGFAQTAMGLADAPDAQRQLDQFIDQVVAHQVPISAFHYGSGYSSRGKRRYVFTWNTEKFPDPKALNAKFHAQGMHLVANIKPCLLDDHPAFAEVSAQHGFIHTRDGTPVSEPFWDGFGAHLDFTHPAAIAWWQKGLGAQVLDYGFDTGWNDNNEYAVLNEDAQCHGFGTPIPMHRARPLHPLLMTRATFEAQAQRGAEVFTVTRAGPPGIQRYAQTWSGDNSTDWENLRWNIRTGLQMSLSGMFNIGHDVGGFFGPLPDEELFVRWVQACCLNPRMVMNSWKEGGTSSVPWMHPNATQDVLAAIRLRYQLMPYIWSLFQRASAHHEPIIRPTFYDFPKDAKCYDDCDAFMLGANVLVAPVVAAGERARTVYLPQLPGAGVWMDFANQRHYSSGTTHTVDAPRSALPLFVRAGTTLELAAPAPGIKPTHDDPVVERRRYG